MIRDERVGYMKKRTMILAGAIILMLAGLCFYFQPIPVSDLVSENHNMIITLSEFEIINGEAHIESTQYNDITDAQKDDLIALFQNYSYRRTFGTLFSDGSISGLGDKLICVFVYDGSTLVDSIFISETGKFSTHEKTYQVKNAAELIDQIITICQ